jgi:MoaA/NifB/PqqE/SkfB family radical SAM enzyme
MIDYKNILSLDLEVSSLCNAKCPVCNRRGAGGVKNKLFTETFVSLEDVKNWFPVDLIAKLHNLTMCGNYGDPMTNPELIPILRYIKSINPGIHFHMNTNASGRDPQFWRDLGEIFKENGWLTFSVDGLEDTNWIYRRGTNWKKIMSAMTNYLSTGAKSKWEFLVFQHNQHQIEEARQLSKELKITHFFSKTAMGFVWADDEVRVRESINVYGNNGQFEYNIHPPTSGKYTNKQVAEYLKQNNFVKTNEDDVYAQFEKSKKSTPVFRNTIEYERTINLTGPLTEHEKRLGECDIDCQALSASRIFISSEGLVFPCCYTGGKYYEPDNEVSLPLKIFIDSYGKENISLRHNTLKDIIDGELFTNGWIDTFKDRNIRNKRLRICSEFCGKGMNDEVKATLSSVSRETWGNNE